jgi:hypothetical protein
MVTRRRLIRTGLTTVAAVSGTAAAMRPMLATGQPADDQRATAAGAPDTAAPAVPAGTALFDEVYRGRRVQGFTTADDDRIGILVDGRPLHVMRRVDGSWISMANHFQPYPTPLATARGAVDVMRGATLASAPLHLPFLRP